MPKHQVYTKCSTPKMMNKVQKCCCASILTSCSKIGTSVLALYFFRSRVGECRLISQNINTHSSNKPCYFNHMKKTNVGMEALLFQKYHSFSIFFCVNGRLGPTFGTRNRTGTRSRQNQAKMCCSRCLKEKNTIPKYNHSRNIDCSRLRQR